ncbi:MAG: hypothetical protein ACK2UP_21350, partial [Candidatus Promineifilaceae bacterium]
SPSHFASRWTRLRCIGAPATVTIELASLCPTRSLALPPGLSAQLQRTGSLLRARLAESP